MSFLEVARAISAHPVLADVEFGKIELFLSLTRHLKTAISYAQLSYIEDPPESLPANIQNFLVLAISLPDEIIKHLWNAVRHTVWRHTAGSSDGDPDCRMQSASLLLPLFMKHGLALDISFYTMYPPTRVCLTCKISVRSASNTLRARELVSPLYHAATIFTVDFGPVPGFAMSLYCSKCRTRYYANYYVHQEATVRTYYATPLPFIQISQHFYASAHLCEVFVGMMLNAWTSATNCARIYNDSMTTPSLRAMLPIGSQWRFDMNVEDVWSAFFLRCLIIDTEEQRDAGEDTVLELPHDASSQAKRLQSALRDRNQRLEGTGQECWNHACERCCWFFTDESGTERQLRSVVVDGVTLGHSCCGIHNCTEPLVSVKDHYCTTHHDHTYVCAVLSCSERVEPGFRTCASSNHRALESWLDQKNKGMFQLKRRLERAGVTQTNDAFGGSITASGSGTEAAGLEGAGVDGDDVEIEVDESGICDGKPATGNRSIRARFGRRRTHNEELCVASCGVILGRATFYGSEAPNGVRTFLMGLFPTRQSLPGVIWHDNNCQIAAMLRNEPDEHLRTYFDDCALPVDVFHFKSKHKESDINCGRYCNPALWPQLMNDDGKTWRFNSSAAEQANAWIGGYQAIVREMQVDRYNFFLDEMIKRRNRQVVARLRSKHEAPYLIPRHELLDPTV